mgnify:FL=1
MVDLSTNTIQKIFEKQMRELTSRSLVAKEDLFDYQMSGAWF